MDKDRIMRWIGSKALPNADSDIDMLVIIQSGLPVETLATIRKHGIINDAELTCFIPTRTLARRKKEKRLSPEESDKIAGLARVFDYAVEVFGTTEKAHKWLRTPNRALKGELPLSLLHWDFGARVVETLLGRIDHGVYS